MRKDVKIGLTIGGVLLAVLIVYLLVPKNTDTRHLAKDTDSSGTTGERREEPGTSTGGNPTTPTPPAPSQETPREAVQTPQPPAETPAGPERPSGQELAQAPGEGATGASVKSVDWETILSTGKIPLAATGGNRAEVDMFADAPKGTTGGPDVNYQGAGTPTPPKPAGGAVTPTTPAAPRQTPTEHVVQQGEHLSSISLAVYGDARHYKEILKANPGLDERKLRPGTKIKLPDPSTFTTAKAQQAVAKLEPSIDAAKEYRVAPGDSLHKIAMKLYGKAAKADDLYELNKDKIGDDSARVKVGMVLKLPEPPTANTSQTSR
jgi:nucleoid-associated protein YgaU